jgi:hypothetical protein
MRSPSQGTPARRDHRAQLLPGRTAPRRLAPRRRDRERCEEPRPLLSAGSRKGSAPASNPCSQLLSTRAACPDPRRIREAHRSAPPAVLEMRSAPPPAGRHERQPRGPIRYRSRTLSDSPAVEPAPDRCGRSGGVWAAGRRTPAYVSGCVSSRLHVVCSRRSSFAGVCGLVADTPASTREAGSPALTHRASAVPPGSQRLTFVGAKASAIPADPLRSWGSRRTPFEPRGR